MRSVKKQAKKSSVSVFVEAAQSAGLRPCDGKRAVQGQYQAYVGVGNGAVFTGSIDLDAHFRAHEANAQRWDYGLGIGLKDEMAFWLEPHPASSTKEVEKMLLKLNWLKEKLKQPEFSKLRHLRDQATRESKFPYRWLAAGRIRIAPHSKEARKLALEGLDQPRRHITLP